MPKIFISYRRADSQYVADSIYMEMVRHFGQENVFLDVGSIPFGVDFREYLRDQIQTYDVVLVLIGPDWGRIMRERADEPNDFVRIEIENALKLNKLVIPVRVMNAEMPDFKGLPASIHDLQWRHAAVVRRMPDLANDCQRIADGVYTYFNNRDEKSSSSSAVFLKSAPSKISNILPAPFDWCPIAVRQVTLEGIEKTYNVAPFDMAKYPITNAQFQVFIDAPDGYQDAYWWAYSDAAKLWHKDNAKPQNTAFVGDTHPRTNVCWYEAVAFCNWMMAKTNEYIALPTEWQWQSAAEGNQKFVYPWGNDWDGTRCNNSVKPQDNNSTTPVNQYEGKGSSPFNVVDMSGNVWELCLNDYKSLTVDLSIINYSNVIAVRGGSWFNIKSNLYRNSFRSDNDPNVLTNRLGFRIARSHATGG